MLNGYNDIALYISLALNLCNKVCLQIPSSRDHNQTFSYSTPSSLFIVDDASGHYSSGFFYGNNYWTGSISLCMEIESADDHLLHARMPFLTGFYVLKTNVNDTRITEKIRQIFVGLCLPATCTTDEVLQMARFSEADDPFNSIQHIAVRSPTIKHYDLWADATFLTLL